MEECAKVCRSCAQSCRAMAGARMRVYLRGAKRISCRPRPRGDRKFA
jgi:hypothetical protein